LGGPGQKRVLYWEKMWRVTKADIEQWEEELLTLEGLKAPFLRSLRAFPFLQNGSARVLVPSPGDFLVADLLERRFGQPFEPLLADEELVFELIQKYYEEEEIEAEEGEEEAPEDVELLKDLASEAPVIRLVNRLIREGVENRATDIHFEPFKEGLRVRFRIDGVLHDWSQHPKRFIAPVISRLKLMAKLNIAEHRLPQDGRIRFRVGGEDLDIRVSVIPTVHGEGVVLRLLSRETGLLSLEHLGLLADHERLFREMLAHPNGIILVTGPTGSGKTTTLYAALRVLNTPDRKIITIEDPVEYQLAGINQIQVKPEIGLTFASALRAILRHDPDVILVGEIRDLETAEIAIQSALTGHLVFSTLHTNDALGAVARLHEMGVERYLISASVVGLVAQRLVRVLCPHCARRVEPSPEFLEAVRQLPSPPEEISYRVPTGCHHCAHTGYHGRRAIYEIVPVDRTLRRFILEGNEEAMREHARQKGYLSLFQDGLRKVAAGVTSFEEVLRVAR